MYSPRIIFLLFAFLFAVKYPTVWEKNIKKYIVYNVQFINNCFADAFRKKKRILFFNQFFESDFLNLSRPYICYIFSL